MQAFKYGLYYLYKLTVYNKTLNFSHRLYSSALHSQEMKNQDLTRTEALEKYGLSHLNLTWPKKGVSSTSIDYKKKNPRSIKQMYGEADLSKCPIFQGGFINFGYWPNPLPNNQKITPHDRIEYSKALYKTIGNLTSISQSHSVLDVGCGPGYGTAFISGEYGPKLVVGMDISPQQIARSKNYQAKGIAMGKLRFTLGEAESMPFTDKSFDRIVSIEAAQHFHSINDFSKEAARILKQDGKLVIASFFPKSKEGVEVLNAIVPHYHIHGSQNTIAEVKKGIAAHMEIVKVDSIGENVWHGLSKWLDQIIYSNQWSKIWPALYQKNLIDYVIYQAEQPKVGSYLIPRK